MRVRASITDLLGTVIPSAFQLWLTGVINCTLMRLMVTKMPQLGEQHVDPGEPIVKKRKKEREQEKEAMWTFVALKWPSSAGSLLFHFLYVVLFLICSENKRVEPSLQSNSYVKSFHIGIHLIKSAEGTYLHWQVGSQTASPFSKWKESSSRTSPTLSAFQHWKRTKIWPTAVQGSQLFRSCRSVWTLGM